MLHCMKLNNEPFNLIKRGKKTIELRLFDEKRQKINTGDFIEFTDINNGKRKLAARVTALYKFESFEELYNNLSLEACGYENSEKADPRDMEKYYSVEEQEKYGVLGIEIRLISKEPDRLTKLSKYMSLLLRHHPERADLTLDEHGWAEVEEFIKGINKKHSLTMDELEYIVESDNKQRYSFSEDKYLIRANQGHSIPVDLELEEVRPPTVLYHGTARKYTQSIDKEGLSKRKRLYVHLSSDYETAVNVGKRHGEPVVYTIEAEKMYNEGYKFYLSVNKVWLTDRVPVDYLNKEE